MSPDTPPSEFRQIIADQALERSCKDWKLSEKVPANVLSRAVPNDERQYFGLCDGFAASGSTTCNVYEKGTPSAYIRVKYRDPPVSGSNTINVYLNGGGGSTDPPPSPEPPPRTCNPVCID